MIFFSNSMTANWIVYNSLQSFTTDTCALCVSLQIFVTHIFLFQKFFYTKKAHGITKICIIQIHVVA